MVALDNGIMAIVRDIQAQIGAEPANLAESLAGAIEPTLLSRPR